MVRAVTGVTSAIVGAVISVEVVVLSVDVVVLSVVMGLVVSVFPFFSQLSYSSFSPQEMMVRLKQEMSNIFKIFFNLSSKINYQKAV